MRRSAIEADKCSICVPIEATLDSLSTFLAICLARTLKTSAAAKEELRDTQLPANSDWKA